MSILGRSIAYVVLAAAVLATAITLNIGKYLAGEASTHELSPAKRDLDAELARCKAIGLEAADAGCKAVWEANRNRFFRSGKPYQDRLTDTVTATPDSKEAAAPARADLNSFQRSPTTLNSPDRSAEPRGDSNECRRH